MSAEERTWFLTGCSGAGKTTVGRLLAGLAGRSFVDLDEAVEEISGATIPELFRDRGEAAFRRLEREALGRLLDLPAEAPGLVVALGGGSLGSEELASRVHESGLLIWLDPPVNECLRRLVEDPRGRPLLAGQAAELPVMAATLRAEREPGYAVAILREPATGPASAVAQRLLEALRARETPSGAGGGQP